jgi:hypothetical protein
VLIIERCGHFSSNGDTILRVLMSNYNPLCWSRKLQLTFLGNVSRIPNFTQIFERL